MLQISEAFREHLAGQALTLCSCIRITRADGEVFGITTHDENLTFDDTTFKADTGVSRSALARRSRLRASDYTILGAFDEAAFTEDSVRRGLWNSAEIEMFVVNWNDLAQRVKTLDGIMGDIQRTEDDFEFDVLSKVERYNQRTGMVYTKNCSARLGDGRCKVNLETPDFTQTGEVLIVRGSGDFTARGLTKESEWWNDGTLTWTSGASKGQRVEVSSSFRRVQAGAQSETDIKTYLPSHNPIVVGDTFSIATGCDKSIETCRGKFNNVPNFRGFPTIPTLEIERLRFFDGFTGRFVPD